METEPKPRYEIREANIDDVEAIRHMHAQSWLETYPDEDAGITYDWVKQETDSWLTDESLNRSREYFGMVLSSNDHFYRVAIEEGKVVGLVHSSVVDGHKHLGALYILKGQQGTGLAQRLMGLADEWINDEYVDLEVASYNVRAIRFYEKCGFEITDKQHDLFKGKIPIVTMERKGV